MDEMTILRSLGEELEHEPPGTLARRRNQLTAAPGRRRTFLRVGIATFAALTITGGAIVLQPQLSDRAGSPTAAAAVLEDAAQVAADELAPRPDQFIYTRVKSRGQETDNYDAMRWSSVDGKKDGLSITKIPGGWQQVACPGEPIHPTVTKVRKAVKCRDEDEGLYPGYRDDLPTTTEEMLAYLEERRGEGPKWDGTVEVASELLHENVDGMVAPASMAALWRALARVPGVTVEEDASTLTGRPATAITYRAEQHHSEEMFLFDPRSHTYLGQRRAETGQGRPYQVEILERGIVDEAGELP